MQFENLRYSPKLYILLALFITPVAVLSIQGVTGETIQTFTSGNIDSNPLNTITSQAAETQDVDVSAVDNFNLQRGLQAYYRFDSPKISRGYSLEFDGQDDAISVSDSSALDITSSIAVSAWVKPNECGDDHGTVAAKEGSYYVQVHSDCRVAVFTYYNDNGSSSGNYHYSNTKVPTGDWSHVVLNKLENGTEKIYIDGNLDKSNFGGEGIWTSDQALTIGNQNIGSGGRRFNGTIDNLKIYNHSLTSEMIQKLSELKPVTRKNLSYYQNFNEGPSKCDIASATSCLDDDSRGVLTGTPLNFNDNNLETGSGWTKNTPINRPSARDYSKKNNNGWLYGGKNGKLRNFNFTQEYSSWVEGVEGDSALRFDGSNDYIEIPDNDVLDLGSGNITVSTWVKIPSEYSPSNHRIIIEKAVDEHFHTNDGPGWGISMDTSGHVYGGVTDASGSNKWETERLTDIRDGQWHQVSLVITNGESIDLYLDDTLESSVSIPKVDYNPSVPLGVGASADSNTRNVNATINDVSIYNRALTSSEVKSLYQGKSVTKNLVGRWKFEAGDLKIAYGTSNTDRNGILGADSILLGGGNNFIRSAIPKTSSISFWAKKKEGWNNYVKLENTTYIDGDEREWPNVFLTTRSTRLDLGAPYYESGITENVSGWTEVKLEGDFNKPIVIVSGQGSFEGGDAQRESRAIIRNVGSKSFEVKNVDDNNTVVKEDVGYVVMDKGHYSIGGVEVEAGIYNTSGSLASYNWNESFGSSSITMIDTLQEETSHAYSSRVSTGSIGAKGFSSYWESYDVSQGSGSDGGGFTAGYIAFRTDQKTSRFEGGIDKSCTADTDSGTWCEVNFGNNFNKPPIMFANPLDTDGGDPSVGTFTNLTENGVKIRITEGDTYDGEQGHATVDLPWTVWTNSFEGKIDEIRIYNRSLSEKEVQRLAFQ